MCVGNTDEDSRVLGSLVFPAARLIDAIITERTVSSSKDFFYFWPAVVSQFVEWFLMLGAFVFVSQCVFACAAVCHPHINTSNE